MRVCVCVEMLNLENLGRNSIYLFQNMQDTRNHQGYYLYKNKMISEYSRKMTLIKKQITLQCSTKAN